ncbi:hypothetical protein C0995_005884 [Termitomyces sp. Mi166|nr:hypothetical protein C0995_005884 [Termitomyces sp. Mi166\
MDVVQYHHQDIQNGDNGAMDTTPILQHPKNLDPSFIPVPPSALSTSSVAPQLMQQNAPVFPTIHDPPTMLAAPIHVPIPDLPQSPAFITPIEVASAPHIPPDPPVFLSDMPAVDSFTMASHIDSTMNLKVAHPLPSSSGQVPPPSVHNAASSYTVTVPSSLESALDQPAVVVNRSRANTSVSPVSVSSSYMSVPPATAGLPFIPPESTVIRQEDGLPKAEAETVVAVESILESIERTAKHARAMIHQRQDMETGSSIDILHQKINEAAQQFSELLVITGSSAPTPYVPLQSPGIVQEPKENPLDFALPPIPANTTHITSPPVPSSSTTHIVSPPVTANPTHIISPPVPSSSTHFTSPPIPSCVPHMTSVFPDGLMVLDHSRKRCASELEVTRNVKAPKREPQDDVPLNLHTPPAVPTPPFNFGGVANPPNTQLSSSQPPTPPTTFSPLASFSPTKPTPFPLSTPPISSPVEFAPPPLTTVPSALPTVPSAFPGIHTSWSDSVVPTRHHHHSLSSGSLSGTAVPSTPPAATHGMMDPFISLPMQQTSLPAIAPTIASTTISPPIGRMSRSGSINGTYPNAWYMEAAAGTWPNTLASRTSMKSSAQASSSTWFPKSESHPSGSSLSSSSSAASDRPPHTVPSTSHNSPAEDNEDEDEEDDDTASKNTHHSSDSPVSLSTGSDVPQEYRADVDRIFFEFLNKICSNLDATDAKGEPIHQRLMAKKMQRLDESLDFRPFKFRIQAFTMAFLEELASRGYPEEKIPMKKIRNYLWRQQYILRFNEDGKKAKSKGNHIWNIEAKKLGDGKWEFRPFHRKLAGTPPGVGYVGLKWSWAPHVWDPQASWQNVLVSYSSPSLPSWLSWNDGVLSGIPPPDAESCRITVNAKPFYFQFNLDGQEGQLSHTFQIAIAPVDSIEAATVSHSRRPSLAGDPPRRSTSDSVLFQGVPRAKPRPLPARGPSPESADTRVIRVLQSVAQRVTEEAQSQIAQSPPEDLQELVKQKEVLEHSMTAYDQAITHSVDNPPQSRMLAVAAQNVVVQAAHQVIADRAVASGTAIPPPQSEMVAIKSVTVMELSDATQGAIAAAVKQQGNGSTEVDIMVAATSILRSRTSTGELVPVVQPARPFTNVVAPRIMPKNPLPSVSEYV